VIVKSLDGDDRVNEEVQRLIEERLPHERSMWGNAPQSFPRAIAMLAEKVGHLAEFHNESWRWGSAPTIVAAAEVAAAAVLVVEGALASREQS
jgi:hypothetical protein